ncbi:MAG: aminotransferase class I/II-fold pyridoxal phosphate-dependent enzyme [Polyangiaceae bacterium]
MGLRERIGSSGVLMRVLSDDRVMKLTNGVMDARNRLRVAGDIVGQAWVVIRDGQALPSIDPALEGSDADVVDSAKRAPAKSNGAGAHGGSNGVNGYAAAAGAQPAAARKPQDGEASEAVADRPHIVAESGEGAAPAAPAPKPVGPRNASEADLAQSMAERASLAKVGGKDIFDKCYKFMTADNARAMGVYPFFRPLDFNNGPIAQLEGREVIMLGSNNYLGLTTHPKVREAAKAAIDKYGTSMTGSRLVNGSMRLHEELEHKLAAFHGKEAGLVFTTGYQVNIATISALLSNKSSVGVIDKDVHASIYDGIRLGLANKARMVRYKHNDPDSLDDALSEIGDTEGALVITDGVFSAQGEIAHLPGLVEKVKKHNARIFVDDAHGLGVLGPSGRGTAAELGVADKVDLIGGTFSKSLASIGGWLVGDRKVLDYIRHFAFSFLFAASAAPPCVAAAMAALEVMQEETWRQQKLRENFTYMRNELRGMGFELGTTQTAVIPIYIRQDLRTVMMWKSLLDDYSIYVNPFITPGVPPKQQVLRTSYMATHERQHLDRALEAFQKVGKKFGVI